MSHDYDVIIVGGGIAGLMTAARLGAHGRKVAVFEQGLCGAQATTGNHGMIHSGALYAKLHADIVPHCLEALGLFRDTFPAAVISRGAYYFAHRDAVDQHVVLWERHGCPYRRVDPDEIATLLRVEDMPEMGFVATDDLAVSSRRIVAALVRLAWYAAVDLAVRTPVSDVLVSDGRAVGVRLAERVEVTAGDVILCAGLGTRPFHERLATAARSQLRSRLDMMAAFKGQGVPRSIICLDYGGPAIAPSVRGTILASLHGGPQPWIQRQRRWPVPVTKVLDLIERMRAHLCDGLVDYDTGVAYMCSKTELAGGSGDMWGIDPAFAVVDHGHEDGIAHLYTLLPGKMTLAFHASREVARRVLGAPVDLPLPRPPADRLDEADELVEPPPWQAADE
jgi:glycine/D-amino acid oxidase-like deaminating enzyme